MITLDQKLNCSTLYSEAWIDVLRPPHDTNTTVVIYKYTEGQTIRKQVTIFFYLSPHFYICIAIVDIIVKNNHLRIIYNNFQEILSKNKEMTFTETNKE